MKAAVVRTFSELPVFSEFADPHVESGEVRIRVRAAALSNLVKAIAAGSHYSSGKILPFVPGVDGVGVTAEGERVYFAFPRSPYGAMGELVAVPSSYCTAIPAELDDLAAAALANPGMSSWLALNERAKFVAGETVLILGATGISGRLAVAIAKHLGAAKIIACGRNMKALQELATVGADEILQLGESAADMQAAFRSILELHPVNVVLDYLWGTPAEQLLSSISGIGSAAAGRARVRYVQIGNSAGAAIPLSAGVLRSSGLELLGSGIGSVSNTRIVECIGAMFQAAVRAGLTVDVHRADLADVHEAWNMDTGGKRLVFRIGG